MENLKFARPYEINQSPRYPLRVEQISLSFGGVNALTSVSLTCEPGEILAIIGPNGAGKTSLLNCICGVYHPQQGRISYGPHLLNMPDPPLWERPYREILNLIGVRGQLRMPPHRLPRLGIARTFQNIELFSHMTALDNLMLGRHVHMRKHIFSAMFYYGYAQHEEIEHRQFVEHVIDLMEIQGIRKQPVGSLSYGLQKRVEVGRALAMNPSLILLDEPMAGMNVEEKEDMARFILDINEEWGVTCILIEHDMGVVMDISDRVAVLDFGRLLAIGTPQEVSQNPAVIKAYLGEAH